jgi:AAA domain-containing protein
VRVLDFSHGDIWPAAHKGADVTDWVRTREGTAEELAEIIETLPDAGPAIAPIGETEPPPVDNLAAFGDRAPDDAADLEQETNSAVFTFDLAPYAFPNPALIPPREWLFGRHYIRGAVSATIGAPGRLKSTTVLTEIVGMAVGRDLMTGEALASGPLRAAYLNGEEVQDELDRRVAAICQHFGLKPQDCGGRLFVRSTRDKPIRVAVRGPRGDAMAPEWATAFLPSDNVSYKSTISRGIFPSAPR